MFVVIQSTILKSVLFESPVWAFIMHSLGISQIAVFSKIHVGGGPETVLLIGVA